MYLDYSAISCGVKQLYQVNQVTAKSNFLSNLRGINNIAGRGNFTFLVFSDRYYSPFWGGRALALKIQKAGLGVIQESVTAVNPNSANTIAVWVWKVTRQEIETYIKENTPKRKPKTPTKKVAK